MLPEEQRIVDATNAARAKHGLPPLEVDIKLCTAAGEHARNMASRKRLSHELPIPGARTMIERVGAVQYQWSALGENIAWNYPFEEVVSSWMSSPGYRETSWESILKLEWRSPWLMTESTTIVRFSPRLDELLFSHLDDSFFNTGI